MLIRPFRAGDEIALFAIFHSSVHLIAAQDYSEEQRQAWAPADFDPARWAQLIRGLMPFIAEDNGRPVGYADLQPDGYIDHFYVSGHHARQGVATRLMDNLMAEAVARNLTRLTSHVSRTAQPFFARHGFDLIEHRYPARNGVIIPNALMAKQIKPG